MKHLNVRAKILLRMVLTVFISLLILGASTIYLNVQSTNDTLKQTMAELAEVAAERVEQELEGHKKVATETGCVARLASAEVSVEEKKEIMDQRADMYGYQRGNILDSRGVSIFDGKDYSERDYFQGAMQGRAAVSDPLVSKITGELTVIVAAPLWQDGVPNTKVIGVVYFVPQETFLNDIVASIQISDGGSAYMLNQVGTTIAHKNADNVRNEENTIQDAKSDSSLSALAALEQRMVGGENGVGIYSYGGVKKLMAFSPVGGTNGWSIAVNAPISDFMGSTYTGIAITIAILLVAVVVSFLFAWNLASGIGNPIAACAKRLEELAEGDFSTPVPDVRSQDETGRLAAATSKIVDTLVGIVSDIHYGLGEMGGGNFHVMPKRPELFVKDFIPIAKDMFELMDRQSETLSQINLAADQVAVGAEQVSTGAQALAQGSTEQASSLEELAATVNDIAARIEGTATHAATASTQTNEARTYVDTCNAKMVSLVDAMTEIRNASGEISKVMAVIENIAFQTNILALNAAVEAARAGEAGKGFAVVADEVRNLANKSQEASKGTAELISRSIQAVEQGSGIVDDTAKTLKLVVESTQKVAQSVDAIAGQAGEQAEAAKQVTQGVEQISSVVQTNSATSEESAAASEELSGQAQMLKELVGQYQLRPAEERGADQFAQV